MSKSIAENERVPLQRNGEPIARISFGLGWDERKTKRKFSSKKNIDCDVSLFLLQNGRLCEKEDVVSFANLSHQKAEILHKGDNINGKGEGDDEEILLDLDSIPSQYNKIVLVVNIYKAKERKQHFGMIENAFCRLVDTENGEEVCRFELNRDYSGMCALIVGEIYRENNIWYFDPIAKATGDESIAMLMQRYV